MVSYVPKRRKAAVLLSTQHRDDAVTPDESRKPKIIKTRKGFAGSQRLAGSPADDAVPAGCRLLAFRQHLQTRSWLHFLTLSLM